MFKLTQLNTMAFATLEQLLLVVHSQHDPNDAEWSRLLHHASWQPYDGVMVVTSGGGPTATQRKQLDAFWGIRRSPPMAVATDSRAVRGIVTALNWFLHRPVRAFGAGEVREALEYLNQAHLLGDVEQLVQQAEARFRMSQCPESLG